MARQAVRNRGGAGGGLAGTARQLRQGARQLTAPARVDARDLTLAGGLMLAAAAVLPAVPGRSGLPCPLRTLTGVPCPFCGMTTSVEATVHLRLDDALAANPAGVLAVLVAVVLLARRPATVPVPLTLVLAGLAGMWAFELHRFGFL